MDAKVCENLAGPVGFVRFYESTYRLLCWYVHGSGAAGTRNLPEEAAMGVCVYAYSAICQFGLRCTELLLVHFGPSSATDLIQAINEVRAQLASTHSI